jgi:hypothetical protein
MLFKKKTEVMKNTAHYPELFVFCIVILKATSPGLSKTFAGAAFVF